MRARYRMVTQLATLGYPMRYAIHMLRGFLRYALHVYIGFCPLPPGNFDPSCEFIISKEELMFLNTLLSL